MIDKIYVVERQVNGQIVPKDAWITVSDQRGVPTGSIATRYSTLTKDGVGQSIANVVYSLGHEAYHPYQGLILHQAYVGDAQKVQMERAANRFWLNYATRLGFQGADLEYIRRQIAHPHIN